jgi:hypothetical protein
MKLRVSQIAGGWRYGMTALVITAVIVIAVILSGWFDPRPIGKRHHSWETAVVNLPPESAEIVWLAGTLPAPPFTVQLTAVPRGDITDSGYGLVLGRRDDFLVVAVSPLGYAAVWRVADGVENELRPWQTWPRVGPAANELWLDVTADTIIIRLNQELYWQTARQIAPRQIGLYRANFSSEQWATVEFNEILLFANE